MKTRRSLNLLVAAAGLVFLSGCATETLTDSAFWSYLPFTSHKGGKGSGGHGGNGVAQPKPDPTSKGQTTDGANPTAPTQRSTDPISEGWNDPLKPTATAVPSKSTEPMVRATDGAKGRTPSLNPDVGSIPPKGAPTGLPVRADLPDRPPADRTSGPALPSLDRNATASKNSPSVGLPNPEPNGTSANAQRGPGLGDPTAQALSSRAPKDNRASLDLPGPSAKAARGPLHLPELFVDGIGPNTVGKPTVAELPKRTQAVQPSDGLSLPTKLVRENASANAGGEPLPLPKALSDAPERRQANATPRSASENVNVPGQPNPASVPPNGPAMALPGNPKPQPTAGGTLTGSVAVAPLPAKPTGAVQPLPPVEPSAPLPVAPIPAPFRLSEWISNDALHQAWRRQQVERTQLEPRLRDGEQQRLRLLLDTYLLREKAEEKAAK
jgi:hypothetical protein